PPAEVPVTTIFEVSRLYSFARYVPHLSAQRQSSTAAGAGVLRARRYSTLMTAQPSDKYGRSWKTLRSFCPSTQPPPRNSISLGFGALRFLGRYRSSFNSVLFAIE